MPNLLTALKSDGVRLAVISNVDRKDLDALITALRLEGIFDVLVTLGTFEVKHHMMSISKHFLQ